MKANSLFKSTLLLTGAQIVSYGLSFVRTVILARLLTKADFGLTIVFAMAVGLLEVAGRMAFGQQVVQAKEGDEDAFLATSQTFQLAVAFAGGLLLAAASRPFAQAMGVPSAAWAFALLGVVPLARGFENLDFFRQQRTYRFIPAVIYDAVPQIVVTALAWPLALWLPDYRVIIVLMIVKAALNVAMTHLVAERPFQFAWKSQYARQMWAFGLPLLVNGFLIFASQQADQAVVGAGLSLEALALYALCFGLVSIPGSIFAHVASMLMLPTLAAVQDCPGEFRRQYRACGQYAAIVAVVCLLPLLVVGEQITTAFYGAKYAGAGPVLALLGSAAALRFVRIVPAIASMARADTVNQLYSNVIRCASLPLAMIVVTRGGVVAVAACALAAETAAALVSTTMLARRHGVPASDIAGPAIYVAAFVVVGLANPLLGVAHWPYGPALGGFAAVFAIALVTARLAFPEAVARVLPAIFSRRLGQT